MTRNQIEYWRLRETERNNRAVEKETNRANLARERETNRSNLAREAETHRANVAVETETKRSNKEREAFNRLALTMQQQQNLFLTRIDQEERARSNRANERIKSMANQEQYRSNRAQEIINRGNQRTAEINAVTTRLNQAETQRSNQAQEQLRRESNYEVSRSNKANEAIKRDLNAITSNYNAGRLSLDRGNLAVQQQRASEENRHNLAVEVETNRANTARERIDVLKAVLPVIDHHLDEISSAATSIGRNVSMQHTLKTLRR